MLRKLCAGVLDVHTATGTRRIPLSLYERVLLLWTFRHFKVLPEKVLRSRERHLIETLCTRPWIERHDYAMEDAPIIGVVDRVTIDRANAAIRRWNAPVAETSQGPLGRSSQASSGPDTAN